MNRRRHKRNPQPKPAFVGGPPPPPKKTAKDSGDYVPEDSDALTAAALEVALQKESRKKE